MTILLYIRNTSFRLRLVRLIGIFNFEISKTLNVLKDHLHYFPRHLHQFVIQEVFTMSYITSTTKKIMQLSINIRT